MNECGMFQKDVQSETVDSVPLNRVGLTGVQFPVVIHRPQHDREVIVTGNFYVNLPSNQRGAHLSRLVEAIVHETTLPKETEGIEQLARDIAQDIRERSEYATLAEVELEATRNYEDYVYKLFGYGNSRGTMNVGVEVKGATACPCAAEMCNGKTHNQRARLRLEVNTKGDIPSELLVQLAAVSFSASSAMLLKRPDEKKVVDNMHMNTKFVEDVVRDCAERVSASFEKPFWCKIQCWSEESIHPFDAYAKFEGWIEKQNEQGTGWHPPWDPDVEY